MNDAPRGNDAKHNGLPVAGDRPQNQFAVDLVNRNKANEERQLRLMDGDRADPSIDGRWLAIAQTHLEQAFMAWNRAIFQPQRVALPEDTTKDDSHGEMRERYLCVIETATGEVVHRLRITGKTTREIERIERGMQVNMDHSKFHTEERVDDA